MNVNQKRKLLLRRKDELHPDMIADFYRFKRDDRELLRSIQQGNESALLQFLFKYLNLLIRQMRHECSSRAEAELFVTYYLPVFRHRIQLFANEFADVSLPDDWYYHGKYRKFFRIDITEDVSRAFKTLRKQAWAQVDNDGHTRLSRLNDLLIIVQRQIIEKAQKELTQLQIKLADTNDLMSDYEYFVGVDFFTADSDGNPIFTSQHNFGVEDLEEQTRGLLNDADDWLEGQWPAPFEQLCCYLMHELLYHSGLGSNIFQIEDIWVNTKIWHQHMINSKSPVTESQK